MPTAAPSRPEAGSRKGPAALRFGKTASGGLEGLGVPATGGNLHQDWLPWGWREEIAPGPPILDNCSGNSIKFANAAIDRRQRWNPSRGGATPKDQNDLSIGYRQGRFVGTSSRRKPDEPEQLAAATQGPVFYHRPAAALFELRELETGTLRREVAAVQGYLETFKA